MASEIRRAYKMGSADGSDLTELFVGVNAERRILFIKKKKERKEPKRGGVVMSGAVSQRHSLQNIVAWVEEM